MAEFLDTQACSHAITEIIKRAEKQIFIVSPYLRFSQVITDRLNFAAQNGVEVSIVYGKSELHSLEMVKMQSLKVNLYYKHNLHAKCYANEKEALIASMNLHQFSESHNEEMGILISNSNDKNAYKSCSDQIQYILANSIIQRKIAVEPQKPHYEFDSEIFYPLWKKELQSKYFNTRFKIVDNYIVGEHAIMEDVHLTTKYGFLTVELPFGYQLAKQLKHRHEEKLKTLMADYRCFWSAPYNNIFLYHAKDHALNSIEEDLEYCRRGETLITEFVKQLVLSIRALRY